MYVCWITFDLEIDVKNAELIARLRSFETDHKPEGWPAIQMRDVSALLDAIDALIAERDALQAQLAAAQGQIYEGNDVKVAMAIQNTTEVNKLKAKLLEAETESNDYRKSAMNLLTEVNALRAKLAAPIPQQQSVPEGWKQAVALAYGHLWHVNNEPMAPIPLRSSETAAYEARKQLRDLLTHEERGLAINQVQVLLAAAPQPKEPK